MTRNLITGGEQDPFLPVLREAIRHADKIRFAVSFIKSSGLELILPALIDAVTIRKAGLTLLTSDYLDITDPQALRGLMLLAERGADIRVFQAGDSSFHLKAYIFTCSRGEGRDFQGTAFIGSSNISRAALTDGIEWNYRITISEGGRDLGFKRFREVEEEYRRLLENPRVVSLSHEWIVAYEKRRRQPTLPVAPGSNDRELPVPEPNHVQKEALAALETTRAAGYRRGLVVMATGLGKTYLAAFDAERCGAKRLLFVAHREEILLQAEATFQRIHPDAEVGRYSGKEKRARVDFLFASIQTLSRTHHLARFDPDHFDYIVVDEFHHAAAQTYRRLLGHFQPRFLLGLTATPDRTDQSDILSLCDDNLVYTNDLFQGIGLGLLSPFHYYGIYDKSVDYREIPWRNGRFDPDALSSKLATLARARHALHQWRKRGGGKTLAFCVSIKHALFMADRFRREGVRAVAVYGGSNMDRGEALEQLEQGRLQVIFSVDLFNEGVDLPAIDTVMMLRPTDSKVLFLQQLGRGLRLHPEKEHLVVLDFIGNHRGFLNKPQALFGLRGNLRELTEFAEKAREGVLDLPPGCYVNYDLEIIDFLSRLAGKGPSSFYRALGDSLGRRPTLVEYFRSGASVREVRSQYGQWWNLVREEGDLGGPEIACLDRFGTFFREVETTKMTKSFKMVLLEALLEHDGFRVPPTLQELSAWSLEVLRRRPGFLGDIRADLRDPDSVDGKRWLEYWKRNPVNAWTGGNTQRSSRPVFEVVDGRFLPTFPADDLPDAFHSMLQELVDYRLAAYEPRLQGTGVGETTPVMPLWREERTELPYFPDLRIACGYFREGRHDVDETRLVSPGHGRLDPARHFIARAIGDSMNGGRRPVHDGDYLLLEHIDPGHAGSITGDIVAIERQNVSGDDQYLLRQVLKQPDGRYVLRASNPDYPDFEADEGMRPLARLREVLSPIELALGREFTREQIPALFGVTFNPGNWHSGHVVLADRNVHVLLVTLNKQGKSTEHRYHDHFIDECHFHWQSQNSTTPQSKRGRELIEHEQRGIVIHLFVREHKLAGGKAAPFRYYGPVHYLSHQGSAPMSIVWELCHAES